MVVLPPIRGWARAGVSNIVDEERLLTAFKDVRTDADARANSPLPIPPWQFRAAATRLPFGVDLLMSDMFAFPICMTREASVDEPNASFKAWKEREDLLGVITIHVLHILVG